MKLKLNVDVKNYETQSKTNKGMWELKRHKMMLLMKLIRCNMKEENRSWIAQSYKLKITYVKNKTSISSYHLEQVIPFRYPNQKYIYEKIIPIWHISCFIKVSDKTKIMTCFWYHDFEQAAEIWLSMTKLNWAVYKQQIETT